MLPFESRFGKAPTILFFALLLLGAAQRPSLATDDAESSALRVYQQGMRLYKETQYRAAIKRFKEALAILPHENILYYLAEAYRRVGELRDSYRYYLRYARMRPKGERKKLGKRLYKLRFDTAGKLSLSGTTTKAKVFLDGRKVGRVDRKGNLPTLNISGGKHELRVVRDDHVAQTRSFLCEFGEHVRMVISLRPKVKAPRLVVESALPGAIVKIDGADVGRTPFSGVFASGEHTLRIERSGSPPVVRKVALAEGATIKVIVDLASASKDAKRERVVVLREEVIEKRTLLYSSIILASLSVAALGAGLYFNLQYNSQKDEESYFGPAGIISYATAGVMGAAALTTGLFYFLGDHKKTKTTRMNLSAFVAPSKFAFSISGRF